MSNKIKAEPMTTRPGWNYETRLALYQLWPPGSSKTEPTNWSAAWTERRDRPDGYVWDDDDDDDGWRPECDFARGTTPHEALQCFPSTPEAKRARQALLAACQT